MLYITLRQFEYVVAVAEAGSLTDAAVVLNVSQPSLSVAITRVENRLGRAVFIRRKGAAILVTPFGHRFVEQARDLLRIATNVERSSSKARSIVLGCFEDIAPWYLARMLGGLTARFPEITFQGREGRFSELASGIMEGRIDVAISYDIGFDGNFNRRKMKKVAPVAFLSIDHPLATRSTLELRQLEDNPLILFAEELSEGHVRDLFDELNVKPNVVHKTASLEMMRSFAAHGAGVGISYSSPPSEISYDGLPLATIPITTAEAAADVVLIWSSLDGTDPQITPILDAISAI